MRETKAGVGVSHHRNPVEAGKEAATQALQNGGITEADFVFVFATVGYNQEKLITAVRDATNNAPLAGCSGEGVIGGNEVDESNFGVSVMAIKSDELRFEAAVGVGLQADAAAAGRKLAEALGPKVEDDTKAMFVFIDGLAANFDVFNTALRDTMGLDRHLPLLGGLAGDGMKWEKTYEYLNGEVHSGTVVGVLCSGPLEIINGVNAGCAPAVGAAHTVTKAEGNIIHEIDDMRATDWLDERLKTEKWDLSNILVLALAFQAEGELQELNETFIRGVPGKDDEAGTIATFTEVKVGQKIWLTRRDADLMLTGVRQLSGAIQEKLGGRSPKFVFHFDCAGRGKFMLSEDQRDQLVTSLHNDIAENAPWAGFYTFGEIAPVGEVNHFHNYTVVLAAFA